MVLGDDDGAARRGSLDDADGSESANSVQEFDTIETDNRALLVSLPAQLHLNASAMQDMRETYFASSKHVEPEPRVRACWLCAIVCTRACTVAPYTASVLS